MFRSLMFALPLLAGLAGCAHMPQLASRPRDADCRRLLSPGGEPLRFCETDKRVMVERGPEALPHRLIDDPQSLAALVDQLPRLEKPESTGLKAQDRVCSAGTPGYITIRTADLARMVGVGSSPTPAAPHVSTLATRERIASVD